MCLSAQDRNAFSFGEEGFILKERDLHRMPEARMRRKQNDVLTGSEDKDEALWAFQRKFKAPVLIFSSSNNSGFYTRSVFKNRYQALAVSSASSPNSRPRILGLILCWSFIINIMRHAFAIGRHYIITIQESIWPIVMLLSDVRSLIFMSWTFAILRA